MKSNSLSVVLVTADLTGSSAGEESEVFCLRFVKYLHFDLGHEVTVLVTAPVGIRTPRRVKARIRDACGSAPLLLSDIASGADIPELPRNPSLERSRVVYEWLKTRVFDVCLFGGFLPDAFVPLQAKFAGQAFRQTLLTVIMRSSAERLRQDRHAYADEWPHSLARDYMERYCAEHADLLLSPSQDLFDWATANGWKLASNRRVLPLLQGWREGVPMARAGFDRQAGQEVWRQIHQTVPAVAAPPIQCPHTPKVSVCVAHFNYGQYLPHTLESLRRQTYENFEVIVVDDGSTDPASQQSFKRLQAQYESNLWRFHQKENGYLGQTRNFAARLSGGELLVFMDADNVAAPGMLERMVRARQASQASCLTCHHLAFVSDEARERGDWAFRVNPLGPCLELAIYENVLGDANFIVCRDVFERLGGFSEDRDLGCEDWEFLLKLMVNGFVVDVIPEPLFHYRFQPASMARTMDRYASHQRALRPVLERLDPWQRRFVQNAVGSYWTLRKDLPRLERSRRRRERWAKFERFWLNWTTPWR